MPNHALRRQYNRQNLPAQFNRNQWLSKQNKKLLHYLINHGKQVRIGQRKNNGWFGRMAREISSRNRPQCKSRFQKLIKRFGDIQNVIRHLQEMLNIGQPFNQPQNDPAEQIPINAVDRVHNIQELLLLEQQRQSSSELSNFIQLTPDSFQNKQRRGSEIVNILDQYINQSD